jgi:hypothetical protein
MSQQTWHSPYVVLPHAIKPAEDDVVLIADSDVKFFRPDGTVRFFRNPNRIEKRLPRHMTGHTG